MNARDCKMSAYLMVVLVANLLMQCCSGIEDQEHWFNLGAKDIHDALNVQINTGRAKNVILFVGDGLGLSTITAARLYGKTEKGYLCFDKFPNIGVLKTYSANKIVPDSACTATALFCGVKGNQKTSGVDATVKVNDCHASLKPSARLSSIIKWAQDAGKGTGFVTTTRVTHATPSALYAHIPNRSWECEANIPPESAACKDIARQLIEDSPGKNINVIMGGGSQCLRSNNTDSSADPVDTWACARKDGRDLIKKWIDDKKSRSSTHTYVHDNEGLGSLGNPDYVLGIFANGHLKMEHKRDKGPRGMPSLVNMTTVAVRLLKKHSNGYLLVVEGGMIDFAHHRGHAKQALSETIAFDDAIEEVMRLLGDDSKNTLVLVTSDHSHSLVISGYADRGTEITGVAQKSAMDKMPYTTLIYGTGGPDNYKYSVLNNSVVREDPSSVDTNDYNYAQQAAVLTDEVTHEGTDVLIYATGPMAHLFHSVHEQTYVANVIAYAAKIGPYADVQPNAGHINLSPHFVFNSFLLFIILVV